MTKEQGRRLAELRRSGAAGKHADRRWKRKRTRGAKKKSEIDDQNS